VELTFTFFYLFFLDKRFLCENAPKHRKEQKKALCGTIHKKAFFVDEERRGGVAAIELPPQDGNGMKSRLF
jgi:hypothetical protein